MISVCAKAQIEQELLATKLWSHYEEILVDSGGMLHIHLVGW